LSLSVLRFDSSDFRGVVEVNPDPVAPVRRARRIAHPRAQSHHAAIAVLFEAGRQRLGGEPRMEIVAVFEGRGEARRYASRKDAVLMPVNLEPAAITTTRRWPVFTASTITNRSRG
jgi:hypothetical protein